MQITVDVPERYVVQQNAKLMAQQLKFYTALFLYQCGQLSRGAACEFAGIDIYTFMAACKQYQIPMINNSLEELKTDLARFKSKNQ